MKQVVITGAAGNLGSAVVQKFLASGYRVTAVVQNEPQRNALSPHSNLKGYVLDLNDENATAGFVSATLKEKGKLDAAILLVGGFAMGSLSETGGALIRQQFALNFETAFFIARPIFLHMKEAGYGRIILIGARPALDPEAGKSMMAYALSKSLIFRLAELLNAEARGKNVTVTVAVPSVIDTPQNRLDMPKSNPDNWVKAEEIAEALEFVCSGRGEVLRETVMKLYSYS